MRRSLKGALLSGLVCPGVGQLFLKRPGRGIAFIVAVCASVAVIAGSAAHQALTIVEKIEAEGGNLDLVAIARTASGASSAASDPATVTATVVLVICWIASVIDAYLTGTKPDERSRETRESPEAIGVREEERSG